MYDTFINCFECYPSLIPYGIQPQPTDIFSIVEKDRHFLAVLQLTGTLPELIIAGAMTKRFFLNMHAEVMSVYQLLWFLFSYQPISEPANNIIL